MKTTSKNPGRQFKAISMISFGLCIFLGVASSSFATKGVGGIGNNDSRFAGFTDLLQSEYHRANPNSLPYESCEINFAMDAMVGRLYDPDFGSEQHQSLLFASTSPRTGAYFKPLSLVCFSQKHHIYFRLPIRLYSENFCVPGFFLTSMFTCFHDSTMTLTGLEGKSLAQLPGLYSGFSLGAGLIFFGGAISNLFNRANMQLYISRFHLGTLLHFTKEHLNLEFREKSPRENGIDVLKISHGEKDKLHFVKD